MPSAQVTTVERATDDDGTPVVNVRVDGGGGDEKTLELALAPGDDSLPLPGDVAHSTDDGGTGTEVAIGFQDTANAGKAAPGEKRFYARSDDGTIAAEVWLKGNGDVAITSIKSGGKIILNGVEIDQQGNVKSPGEVTAMATGPSVPLSQLKVPSPFGPLGPPIPVPAAPSS